MKNMEKWILPFLFILVVALIISYIVTLNKTEKTCEHLTNKNTKNLSSEKISLLLPYLKIFLLSNYPVRKSIKSDWNKKYSTTWEDLSGNNNDFKWSHKPALTENDGFKTTGNTLIGPPVDVLNFEDTHQMTIILKIQLIDKDKLETESKSIGVGEIIANAKLLTQNKAIDMSINVTPTIKESFTNIVEDLMNGNQTQETLKNILDNANNVKDVLDNSPNNGKKSKRNPIAFALYGNDGKSIEIRVPNGTGHLEVSVSGKPTTNLLKMQSVDDTTYVITYTTLNGKGHLNAYVNNITMVDEDVEKINMGEKNITVNPSGDLNVGLKEISILNRALNKQEVEYFSKYGIVLRTILDNPRVIEDKKYNIQEEKCNITCSTNKCVEKCNEDKQDYCPKVTRDTSGNYMIKGTSYGNSRRVAKEIYRTNYPKCKNIPDILEEWYNREVVELDANCPFIVNSPYNPCKQTDCENVDWSASTSVASGMNKKCRKKVDSYCEENAYLDVNCSCWRTENKDLPECREYISQFNNPKERGCNPADFDIRENPEFDQYIRKDRIPCYGCDIDELPK